MTESTYLWITVVGVAAIFLAVFLPARWLAGRLRTLWQGDRSQEEPLGGLILAEDQDRDSAGSWADNFDRGFRVLVRQSGTSWTPGQVLVAMVCLAILASGLAYLLREDLALVTLALFAAVTMPVLVLVLLRSRWRNNIQQQMPDVFFLMSRSLRAGLTIDQALLTAAQMGPSPMAKELNQAVEQCKLGLAATAALQGVAGRLNMVDFDAFVMTVSLHRNVGGNLSVMLDRLATSVRDRNLFRGHFRAATALGRLTAMFLAIAAPALLVGSMLLQPEFMTRFTASPAGWRMLAVASGLEILGCAWVFCLLRTEK